MADVKSKETVQQRIETSLGNVVSALWERTMARFATKSALNAVAVGSQAAELFTFYVDPETMRLRVASTAAYAESFKVVDGHLRLNLSV